MGLEKTVKYVMIVILILFFYLAVGFDLLLAGVNMAMGYLQQSGLTTISVPYQTYDPNTGAWNQQTVTIDISALIMFTITVLIFFMPFVVMLYLVRKI